MFRSFIFSIWLILISVQSSFSSELHILGYKTLIKTNSLDCEFEYVDNWIFDEYHCHIYRSETDVLEFNSDPHTQIVGRIHRQILIDVEDIPLVYDKIISEYGEPKDKTPLGDILVWGNSTILQNTIIENKGNGGIGLSVTFGKCSSNIDCGLFNDFNTETTYVEFMLMNSDWNEVNRESIRVGKDQSEEVFYRKYGKDSKKS